jgi:hypothetical protein
MSLERRRADEAEDRWEEADCSGRSGLRDMQRTQKPEERLDNSGMKGNEDREPEKDPSKLEMSELQIQMHIFKGTKLNKWRYLP